MSIKVFFRAANSARKAAMVASIIESTDSCEVFSVSSEGRGRHIVWAKLPEDDSMWVTLREVDSKIADLCSEF